MEVELRIPELRWHGFVDLLTLSKDSCEIRDFKTGAVKEADKFQLHIYALLWARDQEVNPFGRIADRLVLSYNEREVEVSVPNREEIRLLEEEIENRTARALSTIGSHVPEARPSHENCPQCYVRHLCEEYWKWPERHKEACEWSGARFVDIEIGLTGQHGPRSWDGIARDLPGAYKTQSVVLRTANVQYDLHPGERIRVLNVHMIGPNEEERLPIVATMGVNSEVFVVST